MHVENSVDKVTIGGPFGVPPSNGRLMPKITAKRLRFLLENQRYKCAMTGWDLTPETATIDHVIALSKGGKNTMDNVQIVHSLVNQAKHTMSMQQFVEMCRAVAAHADRKPD